MQSPVYSLRAENLAGSYAPPASDYPVRLLTRRVYALSADQISEARATAPWRVSYGGVGGGRMRPPC